MNNKILDIANGWINAAVSSGYIQIEQVIIFFLIAGPLALIIWKIREIIEFINEVKNSKLNELQHLLDSHEFPVEISTCIKEDFYRLVSYRLTGISDVACQKIILRLLITNRELIPVRFFKKFRTFLLVKDGTLIFKKGFSFWFEIMMYILFSIQFLSASILSLALSTYRYDQLSIWEHLICYSVAIIMFLFFISFARMIPLYGECKLLDKILLSQCNDSSKCVVDDDTIEPVSNSV